MAGLIPQDAGPHVELPGTEGPGNTKGKDIIKSDPGGDDAQGDSDPPSPGPQKA